MNRWNKSRLVSRGLLLAQIFCFTVLLPLHSLHAISNSDNELLVNQGSKFLPDDYITPCGPIFFSLESSNIDDDGELCLQEIVIRLRAISDLSVVIDGHRDPSEGKSVSAVRARVARDYMVKKKGIASSRLILRDFGDTCLHASTDAALNPRIEFGFLFAGKTIKSIFKDCASSAKGSFEILR